MPLNAIKRIFFGDRSPQRAKLAIVAHSDTEARSVVSTYLEHLGWTVETAGSAVDFVKAVRTAGRPRLLVLPLCFENGENGIALMKELREEKEFRRVPAIFLCTKSKTGDSVRVRGTVTRSTLLAPPFNAMTISKAVGKVTGDHTGSRRLQPAGV
jgi:CheY-like chemotaxis protein